MVEPTHLIQILVNLDHLPKDRGHLSKFYPSKPRSNSPTIWNQSTIKNMVDFPLITCHVNVGSWRAHHHPPPSLETSSPPVQQLRLVGPHGAVDSPTTERSQGISPRRHRLQPTVGDSTVEPTRLGSKMSANWIIFPSLGAKNTKSFETTTYRDWLWKLLFWSKNGTSRNQHTQKKRHRTHQCIFKQPRHRSQDGALFVFYFKGGRQVLK